MTTSNDSSPEEAGSAHAASHDGVTSSRATVRDSLEDEAARHVKLQALVDGVERDGSVPLLGLEPSVVEKSGFISTLDEDSNQSSAIFPLLGTISLILWLNFKPLGDTLKFSPPFGPP